MAIFIDPQATVRSNLAVCCPGDTGGTAQSRAIGDLGAQTSGDLHAQMDAYNGRFRNGPWNKGAMPHPTGAVATATAVNAEATLLANAIPNARHGISGLDWSLGRAPSGVVTLTVESPSGSILWGPHAVTAAGPGFFDFDEPLLGARGGALIARLSAGGNGVSGSLAWTGYHLS